jgi:hypothetical protein
MLTRPFLDNFDFTNDTILSTSAHKLDKTYSNLSRNLGKVKEHSKSLIGQLDAAKDALFGLPDVEGVKEQDSKEGRKIIDGHLLSDRISSFATLLSKSEHNINVLWGKWIEVQSEINALSKQGPGEADSAMRTGRVKGARDKIPHAEFGEQIESVGEDAITWMTAAEKASLGAGLVRCVVANCRYLCVGV